MLTKLEHQAIPVQYDLKLRVFPEEDSFTGKITIKTEFNTNMQKLTMNSLVKIKYVSLEKQSLKFYSENEFLIIEGEFKKGVHEINIEFEGKMNQSMDGFYKSEGGIYSTQFEPGSARKAFPCFDQPDMKAVFRITLIAPKHLTIISNSEVKKVTEIENEKIVEFEDTPTMATYLVAWVIGPLEFISLGIIKIYAEKGKARFGNFAITIANEALSFYENYFKIPYPLKKLDLVAIPEFSSGGMENWGLITFHESVLLYFDDVEIENKSSQLAKKEIVDVVCHELAHQWFGNLVTMKWWNDLWLNEGFATWIPTLVIPKTSFSWDYDLSFQSEVDGALGSDSFLSSHAIVSDADPEQIFDSISYSKGAAIIRMIADNNMDEFRNCISRYLKDKSGMNATSEELMEYLNFKIDKWINQEGFPLITLHKNGTLSQKRFTYLENESNCLWNIIVHVDYLNGHSEHIFFEEKIIFFQPKYPVFKLNSGSVGFFRIKYEDSSVPYKLLEHNLKPIDRMGVINDLYALFLSRDYKYENLIAVIKMYKNEEIYEVMDSVLGILSSLKKIFIERKDAINELINEFCSDVNINGCDDINESSMRALKVSSAVDANNKKISNFLIQNEVDPIFRTSKLIATAKTMENFDTFLKLYKETDTPGIKSGALIACAQIKNEENALNLIDKIGTEILLQDLLDVYYGLSINPSLNDKLVDATIEKWTILYDLYVDSKQLLSSVLEYTFSDASNDKHGKIMEFFKTNKFGSMELTVKNVMESMEINFLLRNN